MTRKMRIDTRDHQTIEVSLAGNAASGKRVVLIHSLAMDHRFWAPVVAALGDSAQVLIYDCRGHGASSKPRQSYTVEQFADDLADLLDHLRWDSAVVAGASMGGTVALAFAARYPQRTAALGLFDTTAWYGSDAPKQWAERAEKAAQEGLTALVGFQATRWFSDAFRARRPDIIDASVGTFLRNDVAAYAATCNMLGVADLREDLSTLRMPTRIGVGEEDYATPPAMAEALHRGIAGSTLTVFEGARHLTPLEVPERIAAELRLLL
jgi:3-oxoadipate enol-lactonase